MNGPSVSEIAEALKAVDFPPRFEAHESRLLIKLLRLVAEGSPLLPSRIEEIASSLQMPLEVVPLFMDQVCERDRAGNIVGILGLSQEKHPHRFTVNNRSLSTWCAWDALFLPVLLGQTAEVESTCPATQAKIRVRISPKSVEEIHPADSVITIALPNEIITGFESVEKIWKAFCCFVHFFASEESAMEWISANNHNLNLLAVEDGYELGRMTFEYVSKFAEYQGADL